MRFLRTMVVLASAALFASLATLGQAAATPPAATPASAPPATDASLPVPQRVFYESNGLRLRAYLYVPSGAGPFPVYLWNHGSEPNPVADRKLAQFWLAQGFAYFKPIRSGQGGNPGTYIGDEEKPILQAARAGKITHAESYKEIIALHERANEDVIAAYRWLIGQSFVDKQRMVVGGGSYGGIQSLLTYEADAKQKLGIRCFIAMSPAAESWNPGWAARLTQAVNASKTPLFLLQAHNDYNLGPSKTLGPLIDAKGLPSRHMIFPVYGNPADHTQGHAGFMTDPAAWGTQVLQYLKDCGVM